MAVCGEAEEAAWHKATHQSFMGLPSNIRSLSSSPNSIFVASGSAISCLNLINNSVSDYAGHGFFRGYRDGDRLTKARLSRPTGLYNDNGKVLFCDNSVIRIVDGNDVKTVAGCGKEGWVDGSARGARFYRPCSIVVLKGVIYVASDRCKAIRRIKSDGSVSTIGTAPMAGKFVIPDCSGIGSLCASETAVYLCYMNQTPVIAKIEPKKAHSEPIVTKKIRDFSCVAFDRSTESILVADRASRCIWSLDPNNPTAPVPIVAPAKRYEMCADLEDPTVVHLTRSGDLWWSNYNSSYAYCISSVSLPPVRLATDNTTDFSSLIDSSYLSDLQVRHTASNRVFYLHTDLLEPVYGLDSLKKAIPKLEQCDLPEWSLETFFSLLYGSQRAFWELSEVQGSALDLIRCLYLFELIGMDPAEEIVEWTKTKLLDSLQDLGTSGAWSLIQRIVSDCHGHLRSIELVCWYLRSQNVHEEPEFDKSLQTIKDKTTRATVRGKIEGNEVIHIITQSDRDRRPRSSLTEHLEDLANALSFGRPSTLKLSSSLSVSPGNFAILISRRKGLVFVHDWVLYQTWPYFRRAIDAGLTESSSRKLKLPSGFPPNLLICLLKFLYSGGTIIDPIASNEEGAWYIDHGGEFDFIDATGHSRPGFEALYNHCIIRKRQLSFKEPDSKKHATTASKGS